MTSQAIPSSSTSTTMEATEPMDTTLDNEGQQQQEEQTTLPQQQQETSTTTATTTTAEDDNNSSSNMTSPSRPQRTRRPPSYLEDYEMDVDLRRIYKQSAMNTSPSRSSSSSASSSSSTRAPATPRRTTNNASTARRALQLDQTRQRRQDRVNERRDDTAATTTANNRATTTYVNPLDRFATVRNTAADTNNRFREYQSAAIDEDEALRQLLNQHTEAQTFKNELTVGTLCRHKWAISKLTGQEQGEQSSNPITCFFTPSLGGEPKKLTLDEVLDGCQYHPGRIHNPEQKPTVEIVFSFDATGSMFQAIDELKRKLSELIRQLMTDLPTIRIAVIAHGDYCDHSVFYTMAKLDFTNDIDTLVRFVQTIDMCGGGDPAECYEMAIKECGALNWYKSAPDATEYDDSISRVLVMIGDDVPHGADEYFKIDWREELKSLYERLLLKTYGIQALHREHANEFYQELADSTYGTRLELENFSRMHELVLALCYRESAEHASIAFATSSASASGSNDNDGSQTIIEQGTMSDSEMLRIHHAIHDSTQTQVTVQNVQYEISVNDLACRFVRVDNVVYIEQNKQKTTKYAQMAKDGHKVTWITHKGAWGLIVDDDFVRK